MPPSVRAPINHTVRDLIDSGDTYFVDQWDLLRRALGCSCNSDGSVPFTELVDQAWQRGLNRPDPRVTFPAKT